MVLNFWPAMYKIINKILNFDTNYGLSEANSKIDVSLLECINIGTDV